jgi:hypothetical protein
MRNYLDSFLVPRVLDVMVHRGLLMKKLSVKSLKLPHILEEFMSQWAILDYKHSRIETLKVSAYEEELPRLDEVDEILYFAVLVRDEDVSIEPHDIIPVSQMFSNEWDLGPLQFARHFIERKLFRDSRVAMRFCMSGLAKATRNNRPLVLFTFGQRTNCKLHS